MGCWNDTGIGPSKCKSFSKGRPVYGCGFSDRIVRYRSRKGDLANGQGQRQLVAASNRAIHHHGSGRLPGCLSSRRYAACRNADGHGSIAKLTIVRTSCHCPKGDSHPDFSSDPHTDPRCIDGKGIGIYGRAGRENGQARPSHTRRTADFNTVEGGEGSAGVFPRQFKPGLPRSKHDQLWLKNNTGRHNRVCEHGNSRRDITELSAI